jgi:hypothetical protein
LEVIIALAGLIAGGVLALCFSPHGREAPSSAPASLPASGLTQGEPPMRLSLLNLTPDEYAELAAQLGPDGAARVAAARPKLRLVRSGVAGAVVPSGATGDAGIDNGVPGRRPGPASSTAPA